MKPLSGMKIIELTTYLAASGATRILADQGAEVIKIEPLEGDMTRMQGYLLTVPTKDEENPCFDVVNANKKFVSVDLKSNKAMDIMHKMIEECDILVTNYREEALQKLGLSYEQIKGRYPELVYGHLLGYGEKGEDATRPGYDLVAYCSRTGFMTDTVVEGGTPLVNLAGVGDHPTAVALAQGLSAAYIQKLRTGKGDKVSVSLFHTGIWSLSMLVLSAQFKGKFPIKYEHPALSPLAGHPYKCADGKWVLFMVIDFKKYYKQMYTSIGRPDLIEDERYNNALGVKKNEEEMVAILSEAIAKEPLSVWAEKWGKEDIPYEGLRGIKDLPNDQQALDNDFLRPITYPSGDTVYMPTSPIQFRSLEKPDYVTTRKNGADTTEVMTAVGYSEKEIDALRSEGVIK